MALPGFFLLLQLLFVQARGPFYVRPSADPEYAYLFNSLNLATGRKPHHVDHPGTTLQLLGAAVIRLAHPFASSDQKIAAVLEESERHLQWINNTLAGIYAVSLALVGIILWRQTGQWLAPLMLQASPFLLGDEFLAVARVSAEPMLLIVGIWMAALLYMESRREMGERASPRALPPWLAATLALAFLAATGMVTKLTFFPMVLVPLALLPGWRPRATYVLCTGAFACLWLLPLGDQTSRLTSWINRLALREGRYGSGEEGVLPPEYLTNFARLVTQHRWLILLVATSWVVVLYGWVRRKHQSSEDRRRYWWLGGLAFAQTVQILLVAKYAEPRYLLPALMFCPLNLLLLLELARPWWPPNRWLRVAAICPLVIGSALPLRAHYLYLRERNPGAREIAQALQSDFKDETIVYCHGAPALYTALWFGNEWAGSHYSEVLSRKFSRSYIAPDYGSGQLSFHGREHSSLAQIASMHPSLLVVGRTGATSRLLAHLPPQARTESLRQQGRHAIIRVKFAEAVAE